MENQRFSWENSFFNGISEKHDHLPLLCGKIHFLMALVKNTCYALYILVDPCRSPKALGGSMAGQLALGAMKSGGCDWKITMFDGEIIGFICFYQLEIGHLGGNMVMFGKCTMFDEMTFII